MEDDDPVEIPDLTPGRAIQLTKTALAANQALQDELILRAEQLEAEIQEADRLVNALESGADLEEAEDEIQIPGARRAASLFPLSECLNEASPFFEESTKRIKFSALITPQTWNPRQLQALKNAVVAENRRLLACRKQEGNQDPIDLERNVDGLSWTVIAEKVTDASSDRFTADQCRIKWVGNRHPDIDHTEWSKTETKDLLALLEEKKKGDDDNDPVDWVKVAKELGTNRTPMDVMNHGVTRKKHTWDTTSDQRLLLAVEQHGSNNWSTVARTVSPHVTPTQCLNRYTKSLDPSITRGSWTFEEDERLKKAVAAFGSSWVRVAEYIPGRTNDQCNERWTGSLTAHAGKNVWSAEEDARLLELVGEMGRVWKGISERIGNGKTGPSCRQRYLRLSKSTENASAASGSGATPGTMSAASSQPSMTPREMSVQSEAATTIREGSSSTAEAIPSAEARGKKRAHSEFQDENPRPAVKKKRKNGKAAAHVPVEPTIPEELENASSNEIPGGVNDGSRIRPRPRPKPTPRPVPRARTATTGASEAIAPTSAETTTSPARRSARVSARSG